MSLILHIVRKDLRQSWPILAATLALFLLTTWTLATPRQQRNMFVDIETVVSVAWMIATGVLWQREPLPGQRAYWFARPIPWQDLLQAKWLVVTVAIFLPILATHAVVVAASGFPVTPNLPALAWNAVMIVALYVLPVVVLAAITRNLQQLILWVLGIFAAGILAVQAYPIAPETVAIATTFTNALNIVALVAILIWQYRSRSTRAGRIAVIALTVFLRGFTPCLPDAFWYSLQRALSPAHTVQLKVRAEQVIADTGLRAASRPSIRIPFDLEGLAPGQTAEFTGYHNMTVTAAGEQSRDVFIQGPPMARDISLLLQKEFVRRHPNQPLDVSLVTELTVYDAPRTFSVAVGDAIDIPEFGRCQTWSDGALGIECKSVLRSPWRIVGRWAVKDPASTSPVVLTSTEDREPLAARLSPITQLRGGLYAKSVYSNGRIHITLRKPIAHVQRRIELTAIHESHQAVNARADRRAAIRAEPLGNSRPARRSANPALPASARCSSHRPPSSPCTSSPTRPSSCPTPCPGP